MTLRQLLQHFQKVEMLHHCESSTKKLKHIAIQVLLHSAIVTLDRKASKPMLFVKFESYTEESGETEKPVNPAIRLVIL